HELGQRSRSERDALRTVRSKSKPDLLRTRCELERPDRVLRVHVQCPVPREARRPCVSRDLGPDRLGPGRDQRCHSRGGPESLQLAGDVLADSVHQAARTSPGETSRTWAGSTGSDEAWVAVTNVWPGPSTRSANTRRRSGSSSERT